MRITETSAHVVDLGRGFRWGGRRAMEIIAVHVAVATDEGLTGHATAWAAQLPAASVVGAIREAIAPALEGGSPFDHPRLLAEAWRAFRVGLPLPAIGVVDTALWDLAARAAGVSVSEMLGRRHQRLLACASAPPAPEIADCEAMVAELITGGFRAIKLHACGDPRRDRELCRAVRRSAGEAVELMMDAMGIYDRFEALALGRVLDEQGFRWFEDPLVDDDIDGWVELRRRIATPLAGVDAVRFTQRDYARPMADGAFDIVRMDAARHGISQLHALGRMAGAFGVGCEGHAFGPALAQAANLQVALATDGARYCELPVPLGALDFGVVAGLALDEDGYVRAPAGPGLGLEVDARALVAARVAP